MGYLTVLGTTATVVVGLGALPDQEGQPIHPMIASVNPAKVHWVDHIWVKNQDGVVVAMRDLDATEPSPAMLTFEVPEGTTQLVAYEHCNLHGLFQGDAVTVAANQTAAGQNTTCNARFCDAQLVTVVVPSPAPTVAVASHCDSLVAELRRRQAIEFPSSGGETFDGDVNLKHKPFLRIQGQVAVVTVSPRSVTGNGADPLHPMAHFNNPD